MTANCLVDCSAHQTRCSRTNFALSSRVTVQEHPAASVLRHWTARTKQLTGEWSARFHGLHGQQLPQGFWDVLQILTGLDALFRNHLDLCSSTAMHVSVPT